MLFLLFKQYFLFLFAPVTSYHLDAILVATSLPILIYIDKIPQNLLLSRLNSLSSLSLSSYKRCSSPIFVSLPWTLSCTFMLLLY